MTTGTSRDEADYQSPLTHSPPFPKAGHPTVLPGLQVLTADRYRPLPGWARFLVELGGIVGGDNHATGRLVVAVGLPTRVYAAPILAAGIVATRVTAASPTDVTTHFASVCGQPQGTPVLLELNGRHVSGTLAGSIVTRGSRWAKIKVRNGETHFVCESESLRISLREGSVSAGTSAWHGTLVQRRAFLRTALGRVALTNITRESRLECVVVGRRSVLRHEMTDLQLAVGNISDPKRILRARLSDILRIRKLLRPGQPYRSDLVSVLGRRATVEVGAEVPHAAIFDGASSFLKWRHLWPNSNWVVVLDRTEPRCEECAVAIDALYFDRAMEGAVETSLPEVAGRVDLAVFRVPRLGGARSC